MMLRKVQTLYGGGAMMFTYKERGRVLEVTMAYVSRHPLAKLQSSSVTAAVSSSEFRTGYLLNTNRTRCRFVWLICVL